MLSVKGGHQPHGEDYAQVRRWSALHWRWRLPAAFFLSVVTAVTLLSALWGTGIGELVPILGLPSEAVLPGTASSSNDEFDLYKHLGHLSPFFVPSNTPESLKSGIPPGCAVSKAFLIHRHGSRHPHEDELAVIRNLSDYINDNRELFSNPRAELPGEWSLLEQGWDSSAFGADDLTAPGRQQLFDHGVELRLLHPDLEPDGDVLAGDENRVVESARWFMDGYFGRSANATADLRTVAEDPDTVSWITPWETCGRWRLGFGDEAVAQWGAVYLPPTAARINGLLADAFPGVNFTAGHVHGMLYACAYGTAVGGVGSSPWCGVFRPDEILRAEYEYDLQQRAFSGYGLPDDMGPVLGGMLVANATAFLRRREEDVPNLSLNFGHDKTIALGLTALGLAADKEYPVTGPVDPDRRWRASRQMPFAAYMLWRRLECDDNDARIQLVLNGANFDLNPTGCESNRYGSCNFEAFLNTKRVEAALSVTHGDERWEAACGR
ncbi:hypothetical protein DL764_004094 [Monosporascus ibericus]|uniref:3-phytase n=1 Tax=Monosporascus ibericus TaxID=155417 RepID=A0A4V1XB50_9PEZI|nr:hypothetical protein DL764_004094 [Monosporascus ibericus]